MIMALLEEDELSPEEIESMTKGKLRNKIGLLIKAMDGRVTDHHRFLLKMVSGISRPSPARSINWMKRSIESSNHTKRSSDLSGHILQSMR